MFAFTVYHFSIKKKAYAIKIGPLNLVMKYLFLF